MEAFMLGGWTPIHLSRIAFEPIMFKASRNITINVLVNGEEMPFDEVTGL